MGNRQSSNMPTTRAKAKRHQEVYEASPSSGTRSKATGEDLLKPVDNPDAVLRQATKRMASKRGSTRRQRNRGWVVIPVTNTQTATQTTQPRESSQVSEASLAAEVEQTPIKKRDPHIFPFMELPVELRAIIFEFVFGSRQVLMKSSEWDPNNLPGSRIPVTHNIMCCTNDKTSPIPDVAPQTGVGWYLQSSHICFLSIPDVCDQCGACRTFDGGKLDTRALRISPELYFEAKRALYTTTKFVFPSGRLLNGFLQQQTPETLSMVRHVIIWYGRILAPKHLQQGLVPHANPQTFWGEESWSGCVSDTHVKQLSGLRVLQLVNIVGAGHLECRTKLHRLQPLHFGAWTGKWMDQATDHSPAVEHVLFSDLRHFNALSIKKVTVTISESWLRNIQYYEGHRVSSRLILNQAFKEKYIQDVLAMVTGKG